MRVIELNSWEEYKTHLATYASRDRIVRDSFIFRGHADANWGLTSTLDRSFANLSVDARETKLRRLLRDFEAELLGIDTSEGPGRVTDRLELLARHHHLPTTLLDWTRSPYVAAYFAFEPPPRRIDDRVGVWAFDRRVLAQIEDGSETAIDVIDDVKLLLANVRAIEQRAVSIRSPIGADLEVILGEGLVKFTIPAVERPVALVDLDEMLITARSLFRDRDGAAKTAMIRESVRTDAL